MRCQSIRSVLRASLVAGLIASCQNAVLSASWKDCLHPFASTCFIHDLQWEQFNSQTIRGEDSFKSLLTSDSEILQTSEQETDLCVAAAEQFEFSMQVDAVFAALRSKSNQFSEAGAKIFQNYSRSRRMLISSIESLNLKLIEWIKVANSFPPMVVESHSNQDFECGWDCREWSRDIPHSVSNILPYRGCANVFVYSLDASTEPLDSNNIKGTIVASASDLSPSDSDTRHARLVDLEPVCPEIPWSNPDWRGCLEQPSICCPQEAISAIGGETSTSQTVISNRPPTLEAEFETLAADTPFELEEQSVFDYGNHWVDSLKSANWFSGVGKRFAFGDTAPRMPVDYAMKVISPSSIESGSQITKGVASQIRTVGQFLVDFANQIEDRIEQVEIARRDNIQR